MAARIEVERTVVSGEQHEVKEVLRELRYTRRTGFVSGVTTVDAHNPANFLMVSTRTTIGAWESWEKPPERQEINEKLVPCCRARQRCACGPRTPTPHPEGRVVSLPLFLAVPGPQVSLLWCSRRY